LRRFLGSFRRADRGAEEGGGRGAPAPSAIGAFSLLLLLGWGAVFAYSVHGALPTNPIKLPMEQSVYAQVFMPQGWKFFTRDPREEEIGAFVRRPDGRWVSALRGPNGSPSNLFGLSRATRAQGIELGLISTAANRLTWQECKERLTVCVEKAPLAADVKNPTPDPTLCGEIGLTLQPPVPWAWSGARRKVTMPSKALRVNVQCLNR